MATINQVLPTHYIDEGRTILNNNDTALNNDINSLNSILSSHTHDSIYYRKSEIDNIKKRLVLTIGLPANALNTWGKIGGISMSANFGIVMPRAGNIVDMVAIKEDGQVPKSKNGFPLAFNEGDVISIVYRQYTGTDIIEIYKNGVSTGAFIMTKDGQGFGPGLGNYIVQLIVEF
jgi:hypothetical protein